MNSPQPRSQEQRDELRELVRALAPECGVELELVAELFWQRLIGKKLAQEEAAGFRSEERAVFPPGYDIFADSRLEGFMLRSSMKVGRNQSPAIGGGQNGARAERAPFGSENDGSDVQVGVHFRRPVRVNRRMRSRSILRSLSDSKRQGLLQLSRHKKEIKYSKR